MSEKNILTPKLSYTNLDIAKFICALLVIVIHTNPLKEYPIAHLYTTNALARIAVPMFFGISGFLLFGQMSYEKGKLVDCPRNRSRMLKYLKKTIIMYLSWSAATLASMLPGWYLAGWWGWTALKDAVFAILFQGLLHLWYLVAVIWAVPLLYMLLRIVSLRRLRVIAVVLWAIECLNTSYCWIWGDHYVSVFFISDKFSFLHYAIRMALPIMIFGTSAAVDRNSRKATPSFYRFLLFCGLWIGEASLMYFFDPNHSNFSRVFVAPFFVNTTLELLTSGKQVSIPVAMQPILRKTNMIIYCLHQLLIQLFILFGMEYGPWLWFLTTVITVGLAFGWVQINTRRASSGI